MTERPNLFNRSKAFGISVLRLPLIVLMLPLQPMFAIRDTVSLNQQQLKEKEKLLSGRKRRATR